MPQFTHRDGALLPVGDARLYIEQIGAGSETPILFLHGGLGSLDDFAALLPHLDDDRRHLALDTRGHGRSTFGAGPLSYPRLEADALAVLDLLDLPQVHLVGFSDGGTVGYRLAARHPERVASLTAIGADWRPARDEIRARLAAVTPASWRARFPESEAEYLALSPEADFDRLVAATVAMWLDDAGQPGDLIEAARCPLSFIYGVGDHLLRPEAPAELKALRPAAQVHPIEGAGHAAAASHPTQVAQIINDALSGRV